MSKVHIWLILRENFEKICSQPCRKSGLSRKLSPRERLPELIYTECYATREIAKQSIFQYIEVYYNRVRQHSTLGSIAPAVFENQCKIAV